MEYRARMTHPGTFAERFVTLRAQRGPLCLGLDPSPQLLAAYGMRDDVWGLRAFCNRVIDAADRSVSVIKPQSAYFERFGAAGLEVLADIIGSIHAIGALSILDVKRGDIGATNEAYATALLGPDSAMAADAITVTAYLGFAALDPILTRALALKCGVFVVALSSNPEGALLQRAQVRPGVSVAEHMADEITQYNATHCPQPIGAIGAVVGLTADGSGELASRLPRSLILAPGLGAQGGTFEDVKRRFGHVAQQVIPSASREVLRAGPELSALADAIKSASGRAAEALA
jgi:orotidine-5'-phosphate decarboxylase